MPKTRKDAIEALQSIGWTVEEIVEALGAQAVIYNQLPHQQKAVDWTHAVADFHRNLSKPTLVSDSERDRLLTEIAEIHQEMGAYDRLVQLKPDDGIE